MLTVIPRAICPPQKTKGIKVLPQKIIFKYLFNTREGSNGKTKEPPPK